MAEIEVKVKMLEAIITELSFLTRQFCLNFVKICLRLSANLARYDSPGAKKLLDSSVTFKF